MMPEMRPVCIDTGSPDEQGLLVFMADRLVAVLVKLSEQHDSEAGCWFLEHGFGRIGGSKRPVFDDLGSAQRWIVERFAEVYECDAGRRRARPRFPDPPRRDGQQRSG